MIQSRLFRHRSHLVACFRAITLVVIVAMSGTFVTGNALAQEGGKQRPREKQEKGKKGQQRGGAALPALPQEEIPIAEEEEPNPRVEGTYIIGVEDHLEIQVWREDISRNNVAVRPDGMITMPLVGDVLAAGRTPMALARELEERLSEYLTNPTVTVGVESINSYRVYIFGQVGHGGVFQFRSPTRLMEAIVQAGGFNQFADESHVRVFSEREDGSQEMVEIDTKKIVSGKDLALNVLLKPRDMVFVP